MKKILLVCGNKEHREELVGTIQSPGVFAVEDVVKTSDLDKTTHNLEDVQLILLVAEEADPPWDICVLRRKFHHIPVIVELDIDTEERASNMKKWGASGTIKKNNKDVWSAIKGDIQLFDTTRHPRVLDIAAGSIQTNPSAMKQKN